MTIPRLNMRCVILASVAIAILAGCGETSTAPSEPVATATVATTPAATPEVPSATDAAAPPTAEAPENTPAHDVTGPYFPTSPLPKEFAELDHLLLATIDENGAPAPLNGFLRPKAASAKDYVLVQPALNGRDLTFTTAPVNGVHYSFSGAFQRLDHFAANAPPYDEVVLSGTLTKIRNGKSVATTPVGFAYQAGG
ncbi:MAG TPA: hypothetical protein VFV49_05320 [Thermoanaerobaculia bacterium]|nr:hypothetical protein [Thermoanaerobaculia bacterium]